MRRAGCSRSWMRPSQRLGDGLDPLVRLGEAVDAGRDLLDRLSGAVGDSRDLLDRLNEARNDHAPSQREEGVCDVSVFGRQCRQCPRDRSELDDQRHPRARSGRGAQIEARRAQHSRQTGAHGRCEGARSRLKCMIRSDARAGIQAARPGQRPRLPLPFEAARQPRRSSRHLKPQRRQPGRGRGGRRRIPSAGRDLYTTQPLLWRHATGPRRRGDEHWRRRRDALRDARPRPRQWDEHQRGVTAPQQQPEQNHEQDQLDDALSPLHPPSVPRRLDARLQRGALHGAPSPTRQPKISRPSASRHSIGRRSTGVKTGGACTSATTNGQGGVSDGATRTLPAKTC